jgi:hypothetical protein
MHARLMAISLVMAAALAGCVSPSAGVDTGPATEMTLSTAGGAKPSHGVQQVAVPLDVVDVKVTVPRSLKVSEAEVFYPLADIVWRGDPRGDRYAQIEAIYQAAIPPAIAPLDHGLKVVAEIEVTRFHCVTDKTRYTIGGLHSLAFKLTIRDAATGAVLAGPRVVHADVKAHGGQKAIAEDAAGITQKQVITERLATVIRRELQVLNVDPALLGLPSQGLAEPAVPVLN